MFTQGVDSTPHGGHMLTDAEVDAFDEGRVDLPTMCCEHLLNRLQGAEHDAMTDPHQTPPAYGLDHLCIEQPGSRHPAWFWGWTLVLAALGVNPLSIVREQGRQVLPEPVGQQQRGTVGGQHLSDMVDQALRHRACDPRRRSPAAVYSRGPSRPRPTGATAPSARWPQPRSPLPP